MATERSRGAICSLVKDRTLKLKTEVGVDKYRGLVVSADMLMVVDYMASNLQLYSRHDGKLLAASHRLESSPMGICLISDAEVAVILWQCMIKIFSFKSIGDVKHVKSLDITAVFHECHAVAKVESMDKLVVSGMKLDMMCWCVVSLTDAHVNTINQICTGDFVSHLAIKNGTVYISCMTGYYSTDNGVYAYDIYNPHVEKFLYRNKDLNPMGLTVDNRGFIYVCNGYPHTIHQLTDGGALVAVHTVSSSYPRDIFYEDRSGVLYITSYRTSNKITQYRLEYLHHPGIPIEILNMDARSIHLFEEALKEGKQTVYTIRVMVVGHVGVGKTTLIKRLLGEVVNISERNSTEGIDVYVNCCDVSLSTHEWIRRKTDSEEDYRLQRLATLLNERQITKERLGKSKQLLILPQGETDTIAYVINNDQVIIRPKEAITIGNHDRAYAAFEDTNTEVIYSRSPQQVFGHDFTGSDVQQEESPSTLVQKKFTQSETNTVAMLKLLQENAYKLKEDTDKFSPLTIWDFAGQYAFYTTHQTFLTRRAIYLLVSNVSGHVTDLVADECYFDSEGIMKCKVHELIEVWLNSIHSCASFPEARTPPVILVGTHVDKISEPRAKGIKPKTLTTTLERTEFTIQTASTRDYTSTKGQSKVLSILGSVQNLIKQPKTKGVLNKTPVAINPGADAFPTVDQPKTPKKWKFWQRLIRKKRLPADAEKTYRHMICERYFKAIRTCLKDKPTRFHLIDEDFAIDNTVVDSKLEDLKRKIVEVASQQPYWGEAIPARWLPLEQDLMRLKAAGIKVIPRNLLEEMNHAGALPIATEELDLFLRFQHDIGTILYFRDAKIPQIGKLHHTKDILQTDARSDLESRVKNIIHQTLRTRMSPLKYDKIASLKSRHPTSMDVLREKIVLDPKWLIDALKSLITADEMFILRNKKAVTEKWFEFKTKGKLSPELLEAIWTKKKKVLFHDNKEHLLLLMEKLNIISKPKSYVEDGNEIKEEDYYLAPCMLRQAMPREIISPESDPEMESTSVFCFMCTGKFLPPPIFHRLVGACLTHWPIAKRKSENLIYCGCCVFDLDHYHRLTLHFRDYVIFLRVTRMGVKDTIWTSKLCSKARKFIFENLSKIVGILCQSLQFEPYLKCPDSDADSPEGLISVSMLQSNEKVVCHSHEKSHTLFSRQLLQYWFDEEFSTKQRPGSTSSIDSSTSGDSEESVYVAEKDTGRQLSKQVSAPKSTYEQRMESVDDLHSMVSDLTMHEECQVSLQKRTLPPGKKYHAFFSYSSSDIQWVKQTVERLENEYGFVCREYDRDNTPGTPLLNFADDGIRYAYKTVIVMSREAFLSGFVLLEIQMAMNQGFSESRNCVVPVLLEDCEVPGYLRVLNYVDARDTEMSDNWWPKLVMELENQGQRRQSSAASNHEEEKVVWV